MNTIGDLVRVYDSTFHGRIIGIIIEETKESIVVLVINNGRNGSSNHRSHIYFKNNPIIQRITIGGVQMNELIVKSFPKTKDAVLVDKWFGSKLTDPLLGVLFKGKEQELLNEAWRLEEDALSKQSTVTGGK